MCVKLRPGDVKESSVFFVKVDPLTKANFFVKVEGDNVKSKLNMEEFPIQWNVHYKF